MAQTKCLLALNMKSEEAVALLENKINGAGLKATRSFDFQLSRDAHADCKCQYHGTNQCDCQIIILIVSTNGQGTATLMVHSRDGWVNVQLVNGAGSKPANDLENILGLGHLT